MQKSRLKRMRAGDWAICIGFFLCVLITLYPFWYVLIGSFSNGRDFTKGGVFFFPRVFSLDNYIVVLNDSRLYVGFFVTLARTVLGTATSLVFTAMVAYAMTRRELIFRRYFYWINLFTMFFSGGLIPFFILMVNMKLYNTFWVYIIPGLYSVYNMLVISAFFRGIPEELHEAATLDGAGEFRIMFSIYFRLSGPVFATVGLWIGVAHWNAYYDTMIYCASRPELHTLQYYLMQVIREASRPDNTSSIPADVLERVSDQTISFAAIVCATVPVLLAFPFLQKFFRNGVMVGSLKG